MAALPACRGLCPVRFCSTVETTRALSELWELRNILHEARPDLTLPGVHEENVTKNMTNRVLGYAHTLPQENVKCFAWDNTALVTCSDGSVSTNGRRLEPHTAANVINQVSRHVVEPLFDGSFGARHWPGFVRRHIEGQLR